MKLVYYVINHNYPTFINDEDLIQTGMCGLCKAAESWDSSKSKFSTYATHCIINEIKNEFRQRQRQPKTISLNTTPIDEVDNELGDLLIGDEDVEVIDEESVLANLSLKEKEVFEMLKSGLDPDEIAKHFGFNRQRMNNIMRKIRLVWRNSHGD